MMCEDTVGDIKTNSRTSDERVKRGTMQEVQDGGRTMGGVSSDRSTYRRAGRHYITRFTQAKPSWEALKHP